MNFSVMMTTTMMTFVYYAILFRINQVNNSTENIINSNGKISFIEKFCRKMEKTTRIKLNSNEMFHFSKWLSIMKCVKFTNEINKMQSHFHVVKCWTFRNSPLMCGTLVLIWSFGLVFCFILHFISTFSYFVTTKNWLHVHIIPRTRKYHKRMLYEHT